MKRILLPFLLVTIDLFSQTEISNRYVVTSADRKKVYIINDSTGRLLYESWKMDPIYNGFRPEVILVDDLEKYRKKPKNKK